MLNASLFEKDFLESFMNDFAQPAKMRFVEKNMKTDIKKYEKEYELLIELPGYKKEDIQIELKDGYLIVTAKIEKDEEITNGEYIHKERISGSCSRKYTVGTDIRQEEISAKYSDGILSIRIPRKEKEERIENNYINIQ